MAKVIWTDPAVFDLEEIAEYIAFENRDAANRLVGRVTRHVKQLARHPLSGTEVPELPDSAYRQLVEPPCRIFFKVVGKQVLIVHVMRSERILRFSRLENSE